MKKPKPEFREGKGARGAFEDAMKSIFRAPKKIMPKKKGKD
jgi:hypothetical protein